MIEFHVAEFRFLGIISQGFSVQCLIDGSSYVYIEVFHTIFGPNTGQKRTFLIKNICTLVKTQVTLRHDPSSKCEVFFDVALEGHFSTVHM
jgi:hypothetical protein